MPNEEELRQELRKLAGQLESVRDDVTGSVDKLRGAIGALAADVRAVVTPAQVEEVRAMIAEMRAIQEGLLLPWRGEITEEFEKRKLWANRIARGEAILETRIVGKYAIFESYVHLPTGETWVKSIPIPGKVPGRE